METIISYLPNPEESFIQFAANLITLAGIWEYPSLLSIPHITHYGPGDHHNKYLKIKIILTTVLLNQGSHKPWKLGIKK